MVNWFSEITFACLAVLAWFERYDKKNDLSAILADIFNLDNYMSKKVKIVPAIHSALIY